MLKTAEREDVVTLQDDRHPDQQGFSTEDILWAVGIWSAILTLTPTIVVYMLTVTRRPFQPPDRQNTRTPREPRKRSTARRIRPPACASHRSLKPCRGSPSRN